MNLIHYTAIAAIALTAACSPRPDSIAPVSMGAGAYASLSCERASAELNAEREKLRVLERQQSNAATGDAIGVFLLAVPMSNLTGGNKAGEVAASKGRVIDLENRLMGC